MAVRANRILIDGVYLARQMKGVGRYVANVLHHLTQEECEDEYVVLVRHNVELPTLPQSAKFRYLPIHLHNHLVHGYFTLPTLARQVAANYLLVPYETPLGFFPCPYLVVCHDVPALVFDAQKRAGNSVSWIRQGQSFLDTRLMNYSLRRAATVFYNSHFVQTWLNQMLGIPESRLDYAPCAPGADFATLTKGVDREKVKQKLQAQDGYILTFATSDSRENVEMVLRIFSRLVELGFTKKLVIAGVRAENKASLQSSVKPFGERIQVLPFFGEDQVLDLAGIYAGADIYLDLSLHEGFGMQVIEAMACGTSVICSNRGALPEVASDAALLVDPLDESAIIERIQRLEGEPDLRHTLIERGYKRAAQFTWEQTAQMIRHRLDNMGNGH